MKGSRAASRKANFQVDPRLAQLLGSGYRSSEEALRELVDNAWDADAANVSISLPSVIDTSPIVIEDDGTGMTEQELRHDYLRIARDRRSAKGERTPSGRRVKGRKGIGKFAGLMAAQEMKLETWAGGSKTSVTLTEADLVRASEVTNDLESIDLPISTEKDAKKRHGTRITLSSLTQRFEVPSPELLRSLLVRDYGREDSFIITVNDVRVALHDVPGKKFEETFELAGAGLVKVRFTVSDEGKSVKHGGLSLRVGGKLVGRPMALGLDEEDAFPPQLIKRVYGEIEADGLAEHVTADWGAIIENSKPFRELVERAKPIVKQAISTTYRNDVNLAKARWQRELNRRIESLPENRRARAERLIDKILNQLYGERQDKIEAVVSVALDAIEQDDYWLVLKQIDDATRANVGHLAKVLDEFGLVDIAIVAQQSKRRLAFLDELDRLISNAETREDTLHRAIEHNLWLLGRRYQLIGSNKSLAKLIRDWLDKEFTGERAQRRPDLLLSSASNDRYVIVEFKRPSHAIGRDDENQAAKYRDDIHRHLSSKPIDVLVVGGTRDVNVSSFYDSTRIEVTTYAALVAQARDDLQWLLNTPLSP
jgi:hypothetical protein